MDMKRDVDHSVEVLLRQSLRASDAEPTGECLDAEVLAAWAEEGLRPDERRVAEAHMAGCSRCQAVAAALIRSTPAQPAPKPSWFRAWNLQWLVPLTAGAVVVAVWFALPEQRRTVSGPNPSDERLSQRQLSDAVPDQPSQAQHNRSVEAATGRTEASDAKASEGAKTKEQRQRSEPVQLDRAAPALPGRTSQEQNLQARQENTARAPQERTEEKPAASAPQKQVDSLAKVGSTATQSSTAEAVAPAPASPPPAPSGAKPAPQVVSGAAASAVGNVAEPAGPAGRRDQAAAKAESAGTLSAPAGSPRPIESPDRSTRWRIARRGSIERSTDGGASWEMLQTDAATELTAGSAPSPSVCWLVGRAGTVLLSTDGRRFVRRPAPVPIDLVAVEASDARNATVTAAGGRTYRTTDGGNTWEPSR